MMQLLLAILIISAIFIVWEQRIIRMIIYLAIFSLITSVCYLTLAAPDVAMAEIVVSSFSTIIFIVAVEKYFTLADLTKKRRTLNIKKYIFPLLFVFLLFFLIIDTAPDIAANTSLKDKYTEVFSQDIGGQNAVTAIYLGYRLYDTLFEALMLLITVVAVILMSWHIDIELASDTTQSSFLKSDIAITTIRVICPVLVIFGIYLVFNGHITPGGGFQGGVLVASFFICRYMIYSIYDLQTEKIITLEKLIYVGIVLLAAFFLFLGVREYLPIPKVVYLGVMNLLIGTKVACGFLIVFYRFVAVERR